MRPGERVPDDQAEITFNDVFVEYLEELAVADREQVLVEVIGLCRNPVGSHPLSNQAGAGALAGWNTLEVLRREHRVVFTSRIVDGVGLIEVLCAGPRRASAVYDMATALVRTGRLTDEEATEIWTALVLLEVLAEDVGLDGWDFQPPAAPTGLIQAAARSGLLPEEIARLLSKDELEAAMEHGWGPSGPDPAAALDAALRRSRSGVNPLDASRIVAGRSEDRCDVMLPRAHQQCIRRAGHPGPHRSKP